LKSIMGKFIRQAITTASFLFLMISLSRWLFSYERHKQHNYEAYDI
jgi:uncharacterized membrane protein